MYYGVSVRERTQYDVVLLEAAVPSVLLGSGCAFEYSVLNEDIMCICILQAAHYTRLQLGGLGWLFDCVQLCTNFRLGHLAS